MHYWFVLYHSHNKILLSYSIAIKSNQLPGRMNFNKSTSAVFTNLKEIKKINIKKCKLNLWVNNAFLDYRAKNDILIF